MSPGSFPKRKGSLLPKYRKAPTTRRSAPKKSSARPRSRKGSMKSFYPKRHKVLRPSTAITSVCHPSCQEIQEKAESDQLHRRKKVADFEGRGFRRVRAVCAVHLNTGAEVAANGAGSSLLGIRGPHRFAPFGDGDVGFKDHREDFAGTHEIGELAKKWALTMNRVEATGLFLG